MIKAFSQTTERYFYDNEEERLKHVEEMKKKGWQVGSQDRKFIGNLYLDDTEDEQNYKWFSFFYKLNKEEINSNKQNWLEGLFLAAINDVRFQSKEKQHELSLKISKEFANIIMKQFNN